MVAVAVAAVGHILACAALGPAVGLILFRSVVVARPASLTARIKIRPGLVGIGAAILSSLAIEEDLHNQTLVSVPLEGFHCERPFFLLQRRNRQLSPLASAFRDHLVNTLTA